MNFDELKALARAIGPLVGAVGDLDSCTQVVEYNDLVSRFRERITRALNSLTRGHPVDPGLELELWLLAKALPGARRAAEAAARAERPAEVEQVVKATVSRR